ncbi:ribosomal L28e protein family-domain-containing protein [Lipomyces oligophaga]|uniref:ribosomal L28e protein family-domain-containing protein n=1 Tax=Lipomyces oligophaga TaxID=45792 RepID=UPI0034CE5B20
MTSISNDLIWELTRSNSSYLVKRKTAGGVQFSKDPLNSSSKYSYSASGFANSKAVGVSLNSEGSIVLSTKKAGSFATPKSSVITTTFKPYTSQRKIYKAIAGATKNYRDDLRADAVKKASSLLYSKKDKKTFPKKVRGKKAAEFFETE